MAKVGDKYIVEIDSTMTSKKGWLYGIKGLKTTVLSNSDISNLEKFDMAKKQHDWYKQGYEEGRCEAQTGYQQGLDDAWEMSKTLDRMSRKEMRECFFRDANFHEIQKEFTAAEVIEKFEAYKREKTREEKIKVNDEIYSGMSSTRAVVAFIDSCGRWQCLCNSGFFTVDDDEKKSWVKTGRHFPQISEVMKQI